MKYKVFFSSVQKEFKEERRALRSYIYGDLLLSRFFEVFLFEDLPASDRRADEVYLEEVKLSDISEDKIRWFLSLARNARDYALSETIPVVNVLTHLDLLNKGKPNHAAILLFGIKPQRFLVTSEVKCMHFHGTQKLKPIPSYQIYKGTVFDLVDKSVDFVMSKLNRFVGTRKLGPQAPVEYDIPQEVVVEGIVNAVAHRNYTSNASVEIMLFSDRLEVWNPGTLPPSLTIESLRGPHSSQPGNPLIAEPFFLTKYIEKAGTGTVDMYENCSKAGLKPPEFRLENGFFILTIWRKQALRQPESQPESQPELLNDRVQYLLKDAPLSKSEISVRLGQKKVSGQLNNVIRWLLTEGQIEFTLPDKPNSRLQKYRLTKKGVIYLKNRGGIVIVDRE